MKAHSCLSGLAPEFLDVKSSALSQTSSMIRVGVLPINGMWSEAHLQTEKPPPKMKWGSPIIYSEHTETVIECQASYMHVDVNLGQM